MKKLNVLAGIGCAALMSYGVAAQAVTVSVSDNKNSAYDITLVSNEGNSWTYSVARTNGRALSHWDLALGSCLSHVTNTGGGSSMPNGDPSNADPGAGADSSVKTSPLIKWDTQGGTFTITLDDDYPAGTVSVLAKTGTMYGTGTITGPNCDEPVEEPPVEEPPVEEPPVEEPPVEEPPVEEPPTTGTDKIRICHNVMHNPTIVEVDDDATKEAHLQGNGAHEGDFVILTEEDEDRCVVTYGDDNAVEVKIWKYVGKMSVEEFDATYEEGVDYMISEDGDYLLQGFDADGKNTSTVGAKLK